MGARGTAKGTVNEAPLFLSMHPKVGALWVTLVVGLGQIVAALVGLRRLKRDLDKRRREVEARAAESVRRHEAAMAAIREWYGTPWRERWR